jgi:hypothetical protein
MRQHPLGPPCFALLAVLTVTPSDLLGQGNPLGPEFRVNSSTANPQELPAVAADAAGNFVAAWASYQYGSGAIFGQRYASSGAPLGPEFRVDSLPSPANTRPAVASSPSGDFVVVWGSWNADGSASGVFGQRYANSGGPLGSEFRVNEHTTGFQNGPAVACDGSGSFVVVWTDYSLVPEAIVGQRYDSSGAPLGGNFQVAATPFGVGSPSVATDALGNFVVAWTRSAYPAFGWNVAGQRYSSSGSPLGSEFRVNTFPNTYYYGTSTSVGRSASGDFVVVWGTYVQDGSLFGVAGRRYAGSGVPLGSEFQVNTYTTGDQGDASVVADAAGDFVIVWTSANEDGSSAGVFGQRFAAAGNPLGPEFRVNTYTTAGQFEPAVAVVPSSGNFVVVWVSQSQDGSGFGVFGQRYSSIVPVKLMQFGIE